MGSTLFSSPASNPFNFAHSLFTAALASGNSHSLLNGDWLVYQVMVETSQMSLSEM